MSAQKKPLIFGCPTNEFYNDLKAQEAFVAELRPGLEGMKQVSKSLLERGIKPVVICDNMMAFCMERGLVSEVYIFSEKGNPHAAVCRTGSLIAAICARQHRVPVILHKTKALPAAKKADLLTIGGVKVASAKAKTYVPVTEAVPLDLVDKIVEE